jgi:hypothetical protein
MRISGCSHSAFWPSENRVSAALTFDDAEVAGLEGGDLHRVLELGPTDLHCARRNECDGQLRESRGGFEPLGMGLGPGALPRGTENNW